VLYRSYIPGWPLGEFVDYFWYYEGLTSPHAREKLLPDAAMELVIDLTDVPKKLHDSTRPQRFTTFRHSWISGMQQQFLVIGNEPDSSMMGVHFRAGGAFPFFGFPMAELASQVVELERVWNAEAREMRERLLEQPAVDDKFRVLEAFLLARARRRLEPDGAVSFALQQIAAGSEVPVRELADGLGLSQKTLISRFNTRVGLAPKRMGRVYRFQRVLQEVKRKECVDWADLAVNCGYYDQAHFNHEFRDFSGLSPRQYMQCTVGDLLNWIPAD